MVHFPHGSKGLMLMRIIGLACTVSSALVMGLNEQTTDFGGYRIHASYTSSSAFKYFVWGNTVAAVYCILSLPSELLENKNSFLFLLDLMCTFLVTSTTSAATAIGIVGKYGNEQIGWTQICQYYDSYCQTCSVALGLSFAGLICLVAINAMVFDFQKKNPKHLSVVASLPTTIIGDFVV